MANSYMSLEGDSRSRAPSATSIVLEGGWDNLLLLPSTSHPETVPHQERECFDWHLHLYFALSARRVFAVGGRTGTFIFCRASSMNQCSGGESDTHYRVDFDGFEPSSHILG